MSKKNTPKDEKKTAGREESAAKEAKKKLSLLLNAHATAAVLFITKLLQPTDWAWEKIR